MEATEVETGLPRELGGLSKQERILWSTVRMAVENGFESVAVDDVVERAGVSRSSFYRLFESLEECMFAAYERVINALVAHVTRAFEGPGSWPQRISRALGALLEAYAAEPEVARMATVEVPAAGPESRRRYHDALKRLLPLFREGRAYAEGETLPADTELVAIGGAEAIIFREVVADRTEELPTLLPDILFTVLVPYVGPDAAATEVLRTRSLSPR
ncbi:MAG TPA: TetR/AcrR family transcriptional regulator [Solirubrobacterales bacterium]